MANSQVVVALTCIDKERIGYQSCSLTNPTGNSAPSIAAGSKVEIGGALFDITADESIGSLAGIANSSQIYFYLHVSGASFTASGSITAPTWDTAKQGWYNGSDRCIGGCYKDGSGNYTLKFLYEDKQVDSIRRYLDGSSNVGNAQLAALAVSAAKVNWGASTDLGNIGVAAFGSYVLPAGLLVVGYVSGASPAIQVNSGGTWYTVASSNGGALFSDGVNMRISYGASGGTFCIRKLA